MTTPDKALIVRLIDESDAHFIGDVRDRRTIGSLMGEAAARLTALLSENAALRAAVERKDAALRLVQKRLDSAAEAAGNGAEKCEPAERDTYLVFRDHMLGISKIARAALSPARKGEA